MFKGLKENINIPMREIEDIKNNQVELIRLKNNTPPPKKKKTQQQQWLVLTVGKVLENKRSMNLMKEQ